MALKILKVIVIGAKDKFNLFTNLCSEEHQFNEISQIFCETDFNIIEKNNHEEPDLIIAIGELNKHKEINKHFDYFKNKLIIYSDEYWKEKNNTEISNFLYTQYVKNSINKNFSSNQISVYTASCNIKEKILVAYNSLKLQTHQNWEWSIYDDSTDEKTWEIIKELAKNDPRIIINKNNNQSKYSRIGFNKLNAAINCNSNYIVELDHDDAFYKTALENILITHKLFPKNGFIYGDWVEINFESKQEIDYGENFAWGYGSYYEINHEFHNRKMKVCCAPSINPLTIRRLWSLCNHPKSWKKDFYLKIGGHNKNLNSADDYELLVRSFLNTQFVHLKNFCYYQYFYNENTKVSSGGQGWNHHGDIIRSVIFIENEYTKKIKTKIEEIGKKDWFEENNQNSIQKTISEFNTLPREVNEQKMNIDFKINE